MKVKELLKTVNVAWSPKDQYPILLAAGTAAQQLDASFNTSASLDLYSLNLEQPGYEMESKISVQSEHRFHKIIWGAQGSNPAGIIVGGCDYGSIKIYSASKMLSRESDSLVSNPDRHTGPVRALDFNPFQTNLLASGASESEIYIWDIVNTQTPMTPGTRSQPAEDVQYIQWNKQVQHILASAFSQRCVIWDLRKNEPIIKLSDANSKIRWKVLQWHPEVATQLCLASEDDQAPIIQLWDLRFATSPLKTLAHHQRGVLSIAWNLHDSDLLLSCAKDNTIVCWNPNADAPNDQFLCELTQTNQWNFDVSWCPRSPGLIVGSSFDGHATVYSLLGGQSQASTETANKIVDSFPGMDPFTQAPPAVQREAAPALKKAPKWLKRPVGASFGFGGKLSIYEKEVDANNALMRPRVFVSQVITNPDMVQRSQELEMALKSEQFWDYCRGKADSTTDEHFKRVWNYVAAYFSEDITRTFLDLLGYNVLKVNEKLKKFLPEEDINTVTDGVAKLETNSLQNGIGFDGSAAFDAIAQQEQKRLTLSPKPKQSAVKINTSDDEDGLITQAILVGNIEAAVSLCFASKRYADAIILSMAGGPDLLARTQYRYFEEHTGSLNSLINSVVSENWVEIVNTGDITCWKETLVGIFTHCNGEECSALCDALGDRLAKTDDPVLKKHAQICYVCSGNLNKMISVAETDIQETVELVMVMKRALELQGVKSVEIDGNIAGVLSQYAETLASEGDLEAALNYVGNGQDPRIVMLRDRLYKALSYLQPAQPTQTQRQVPGHLGHQQQQQQHQQLNQIPQKPAQSYYNPVSKPNYQPTQSWNTNPLQNSYVMGQQVPSMQPPSQPSVNLTYGQPQILQPQTPQPPQVSQPPSGGSQAGSRPSSVGPQSRPKYMIDPSVKSAPYAGYQQPYSPQVPAPAFNQNSYQSYGNYSSNPYGQEQPEQFKPNIMTPALPANPPSIYDPRAQQQTPQGPPQSQFKNEPAYQPGAQSAGWNDPPIAKSSRAQAPVEVPQQSPIVHPLFGAAPQPDFNNPMQSEYHQGPPMSNYNYNQGYGQNMMNEGQYKQFEPMKPAQAPEVAREVVPEKPKPPIPEEHVHLKTILDELKMQCYETAKNPAMKRKIEDVSKKLEVLYDCLRENTISQSTLQGLHQISQMIQAGNYTNGLAIHTQLVSGPDFSQIASFMPGIKVLLQSALQLGVYIT
ncbi:protein transport protein Sec31A [Microplitis demolitor]|uniref:protein transport protein Sec31A n=1 Tax=Microplitis demolitor TaxID=69319 RepID=UPI0004CD6130|nr:protein transport protein Sec31A [Microplitis demolitor]